MSLDWHRWFGVGMWKLYRFVNAEVTSSFIFFVRSTSITDGEEDLWILGLFFIYQWRF